jgi:glycosyltransferase involved in cell wall biosynthesis
VKIWFWWRQPSGYFDACTRALVSAGHEVSVMYEAPLSSAPFAELNARGFDHLANVRFWSRQPPTNELRTVSATWSPDVVVVGSWGVRAYIRAAQTLPSTILRLVAVDSPWRGSMKQWGGRVTHRRLLARAFDGAWIAGAPQWELVRRLGFRSAQIIEHVYCCDSRLFSGGSPPQQRRSGAFLFAGRLVEEKGVSQLAEAFVRFRRSTGSTRSLRVVGNGPVRVRGEGISVRPFANPPELRSLMDRSCALVNPAFIEHWGVSTHEAASMGLPLILSRAVGASSRFLSAGINGLHAGPDVAELAVALGEIDRLDLSTYCAMSAASTRLGSTLTLEKWVNNFERGVARLQTMKGALRR